MQKIYILTVTLLFPMTMRLSGLPVWCARFLRDSVVAQGQEIRVVFSLVQLGLLFWTRVSRMLVLSFASGKHLAAITISLGKQRVLT